MASSKKPAKDSKKTAKPDVDAPGKSAPPATSKPVIVSNRPLLRDPMVVDDEAPKDEPAGDNLSHTTGPKLKPLHDDDVKPEAADQTESKDTDEPKEAETASPKEPESDSKPEPDSEPEPAAKAKPEPEPEPESEPETPPEESKPEAKPDEPPVAGKSDEPQSREKADAEAARRAQQAAEVQKLIESKKYELPINSVEKRRTKRFVALGILLAIFLVLVWVDVALDAGLIQIEGVKPVTHFFSN